MMNRSFSFVGAGLLVLGTLLGACSNSVSADCTNQCDSTKTECVKACSDDQCKTACATQYTDCTTSCDVEVTTDGG
jgi:hypothetical protein